MKTTAHRMRKNFCPNPDCKGLLDAATGMGSEGPKPDDLSVCFKCAEPLVFNNDLSVRTLTIKDYQALPLHIRGVVDALQKNVASNIKED
jgi:hypothetical protein